MSNTQLLIVAYCSSVNFAIINATMSLYSIIKTWYWRCQSKIQTWPRAIIGTRHHMQAMTWQRPWWSACLHPCWACMPSSTLISSDMGQFIDCSTAQIYWMQSMSPSWTTAYAIYTTTIRHLHSRCPPQVVISLQSTWGLLVCTDRATSSRWLLRSDRTEITGIPTS